MSDELKTAASEEKQLLSWGAISFLQAPSPLILNFVVGAVFFTLLSAGFASYFVEMDLTVKAAGEIISDIGTRDAIARTSGYLLKFNKKVDDQVAQDEIIGTLSADQSALPEIAQLKTQLDLLAEQIATPSDGLSYHQLKRFNLLIDKISNQDLASSLIEIDRSWMEYEAKQRSISSSFLKEIQPDENRKKSLEKKIGFLKKSKNHSLLSYQIENFELERDQLRSRVSVQKNLASAKIEESRQQLLRAVHLGISKIKLFENLYQVRAPISGRIAKIFSGANTYISEGKVLATIVPAESNLIAQIRVSDKFLAKLSKNQKVLFRLESYPYQKYGVFRGEISTIEIPKSVDEAGAEPYFLAKSSIQPPSTLNTRAMASEVPKLVMGMKFEADIILGHKKIYQIVIEKILGESHE
jgi:multidrug resistance efflux pump